MQRIPAVYYKMIEFELYNYDNTKAEIEALKDDIIGGPAAIMLDSDRVQKTSFSDPTFTKAAVLTSNTTLLYMERTLNAIDRALMRLSEEHNEVFEHRYRQGKNWRQSLCELCISQDTYFKRRREIIYAVATQLGLALPV
jgi:RinA family phage transcriptional activator